MSQLQCRFSNDITTLCRRLLIDLFFATLSQCRDMEKRHSDVKTTTIQSRNDVVYLLGNPHFFHFFFLVGVELLSQLTDYKIDLLFSCLF